MEASRAQLLRPEPNSPVRKSLLPKYQDVRRRSLALSEPFSAEDQMLQSMPDASPMKWHLAHTTWFFETFVLLQDISGYRPFDSRYKHLFNSYYKQLGSHPYRGARGLMSRPSLDEIRNYRKWVDDAFERHFDQFSKDAISLIELGLNHEQQHQELMVTDIKHALWSMPLHPERSARPRALHKPIPQSWIPVEGGVYEIGHSGEGFAFDNESPRHEILLQPFRIASRSVANSEYMEFIADNGYRRPELWLSDGWDTVCDHGWNAPLYWEERDGSWLEFTFDGLIEIDPASPVCHVSYYEADAFARWCGARLPREEEWEVVAGRVEQKFAPGPKQSAENQSYSGEFLESGKLHPRAAQSDGQHWFGNVWEWTASPYTAYPGFVPAAGLIGEYNGKFMCNQFVLRGGSCATPESHIRPTYRNFFPPHARWQFMGIRLAQ